jgi:glycosyltransferase involved in cell wall biosynthesis
MPLVIVGDAPYAESYKAQLRAAANERVIFTGFQFGEAYEEFQSNCYLYIQATEVGGTHPALIESMSYGNCVIANGTPENCEVVADAGVTFQKNNFDELGTILDRLVRDPAVVKQLGEKARARVMASYSWDSVVERYIRVIDELRAGL